VGPFKSAGFNYNVEPLFLSLERGDELEPDIVASSERGWLILELTTQPGSKGPKLDRYRSIDPRDLSQYGLSVHDGEPDIITSRLSYVDDGPYCQITVNKTLKVEKEEHLHNKHLKNELIEAKDIDLRKLPEIPIAIVPEMLSKPKELRRGLIDIVMQLFDPNSDGKTPVQLVDEGLERLSDKIRPRVRRQLINKAKTAMDDLIQNHLSEYL